MSTPEQPATPALTRKQMRDIRNTGATPIVTDEAPPAEDPTPSEANDERHGEPRPETDRTPPVADQEHAEPTPAAETPAPPLAAPLPRAALPAAVHDLPGADASVDLGVAPLTRRQARQQERIRTASVPVITPEVAAAHAASVAAAAQSEAARPAEQTVASGELSLAQLFGADAAATAEDDIPVTVAVVESDTAEHAAAAPAAEAPATDAPAADAPAAEGDSAAPEEQGAAASVQDIEDTEEADRAVVRPGFGAELLAGETPQVELPPSFDQLITRTVTGSVGTGNALILSQTPSAPPLVAPVTATGEVLITGSYNLPEGLGSTGHATGTADGKETDAVLVDGELPAHSSPTPIAASAAISTVKNGGDLIKPPTPEKGGRLMLTLAITAGVLALALVGVLILAFVTGVF
jgi:hypothetical protein